MENKVTFKITFHEGLGEYVGSYETLESLEHTLAKLGRQVASGYIKTDVVMLLSGLPIWQGQLEPDSKGSETDLRATFTRYRDWYRSEAFDLLDLPDKEDLKTRANVYEWLLATLKLFCP